MPDSPLGRQPSAVSRRPSRPDLLAERILRLITSNGPLTARAIADQLPLLTTDAERLVRRKVRDLVMQGHPIASHVSPPFGYLLVTDADPVAVQAYIDQLRGRVEGICQRLHRFERGAALASRLQQALFDPSNPSDPSDSFANRHSPIANSKEA